MTQENKTLNNPEINENQEELQREYLDTFKPLTEGEIIEGKVVQITDDSVFVDIGYKSEGKIALEEFSEKPNMGDVVHVVLIKKEGRDGNAVVSKSKADERIFWQNIKDAHANRTPVRGKIIKKIKGGFEVDFGKGITAFVPLSTIDVVRVTDPEKYIGLDTYFFIEKISSNRGKTNIVATRKEWLENEIKRKKEEFFDNIKIGDEVEGTVKSFTSFGAFIDLGGFDGLLHINDMSWRHVSSPKEIVQIGDKIKLKVIRLDKDENRINLSLKHFTEDPWSHFEEKYNVGDVVKGRVTKLADFGAFVEIEDGIEGLVHISEFSWVKRIRHPKEVLNIGDEVDVKILDYNIQEGKLSLGLKQVYPNPWDIIDEKYPVGMRIKRKVKNLTNFGAFFEIEEGIDGLLHLEDFSWTKKINDPSEVLKKGKEVEVMIIDIDKKNKKIKLGLKQLSEDPWKSLAQAFHKGSIIEGELIEKGDNGFVVKVQGDIEGRINRSNIFDPDTETFEEAFGKYNIGDKIKAVVTEINPKRQRLFLSIRDYYKKQQEEEIVKYLHDESSEEKVSLAEFIKEKSNS